MLQRNISIRFNAVYWPISSISLLLEFFHMQYGDLQRKKRQWQLLWKCSAMWGETLTQMGGEVEGLKQIKSERK